MKNLAVGFLATVLLYAQATAGAPARDEPFRRSDVCFVTEPYWEGPFDPAPYEAYGATVQAWGGWPWDEADIPQWQQRIQSHHDVGILYDCTVNMVTPMPYGLFIHPELQEATCLDIEGNKIVVPYIVSRLS